MLYGIDMESLAVIHQFQHPYRGDYSGAGLALNDDGNLWVASQTDNYVYPVSYTHLDVYKRQSSVRLQRQASTLW